MIGAPSNSGQETRQPYELRQQPMAAALPAAEQQDQARETCVRMDIDHREINRLHLPTAAALDIKPAVACFQRGADCR